MMLRMWVAKRALTEGVHLALVSDTNDPKRFTHKADGWMFPEYLTLGRDVFVTEAEALAAARAQRDKKVAALKRQIARIESLDFTAGAHPEAE